MRAATSMFLISLANILPRRASMTAFLCLVVPHLEWPLMVSSLVHRSPRSYRGAATGRGVGLRRRVVASACGDGVVAWCGYAVRRWAGGRPGGRGCRGRRETAAWWL